LDQINSDRSSHCQRIAIRIDDRLVAVAEIDERTIDTLADGLRKLEEAGLETILLSGDTGERVDRIGIAKSLGRLTPEDKQRR
jgi:cation transport ATPase